MPDIDALKSKVTGDIRVLNRQLLKVSQELEKKLRQHEISRTPPGRILHGIFNKAVRTFHGIETLKREGLVEEGWVLLRVLLESHVNFVYFVQHEPKDMVQRWLDTMILDKLKYLREVDFFEGSALEPMFRETNYLKTEAEIVKRFSPEDLKALRRNGFSGLNFEARAKAVNLGSMYTNCYRIASRNVHTFDPAESLLYDADILPAAMKKELVTRRRATLESSQNMLMGRVAYLVDAVVEHPFTIELIKIGIGYEKFRDKTPVDVSADTKLEAVKTDDLYIWRE